MSDKNEPSKLQRILACIHGEVDAEIETELRVAGSEASQILESMRDEVAHTFDRDWSQLDEGDGFTEFMLRLREEAARSASRAGSAPKQPAMMAGQRNIGAAGPTETKRWSGLFAVAACLLLLIALAVGAYAAQTVLSETRENNDRTRETLERLQRLAEIKDRQRFDSFDSDWLDPKKWRTGRPKTTAIDGYARLNDRGSLVTVQEFDEPIEIDLDWRWIDVAGDISYRDTLTIALHSSGEHARKHPYRVTDGIEVTFQSHAGRISIASPIDPDFNEGTEESAFPMPAGKWHHIRIIDDRKAITVYFSGPSIAPEAKDKAALVAKYEGRFQKHHIAIYNREVVGGALHESHVDNFSIKAHK